MKGRLPSQMPPKLMEFFMCKEFGWTLEHVRTLPMNDFDIISKLLTIYLSFKIQQDNAKIM